MTIPEFDQRRRLVVRALLAEQVMVSSVARRRPSWWVALIAFIGAGLVAGGTVSAFATSRQPLAPASPFTIGSSAGLRGVPALPGTQPGTPIVSLLPGGDSLQVTTGQTVPLRNVPRGATDVRVTVTCLTIGHIAWGTDPSGNNPSASCAPPDTSGTFYDFPLRSRAEAIYLDVSGEWIVSYAYLHKVETAWGVNAHGQSFGVEKVGAGSPDLLAVVGTDADGGTVEGYAFATALQGGPQPTSPSDAATYSERMKQQYPNGIPVPVYRSDGITRIGTFIVGP